MSSPPLLHSSPERIRSLDGALDRVPEADEDVYDEWEDDEELAADGLYRGSYPRLLLLYSLAPLSAILAIALLAVVPTVFYHDHPEENEYPYAKLLPYPLPELLIPAALYALTHLLRTAVYAIPSFLLPESWSFAATLLSTVICSVLTVIARTFALTLLLVRTYARQALPTWHDPSFVRVWWAGLGWAAAEAMVAVCQGYTGLALYRDVLVSPPPLRPCTPDSTALNISSSVTSAERTPLLMRNNSSTYTPTGLCSSALLTDPDTELENDLDALVALKARDELESVFGIPLVYIPPFIPPLQRLNAVFLSLGLFLLLGAALFSSAVLLVALATLTHVLLATLHAPGILPRVGLPSAAFVGAVVSLGALFTGLGVWGGVS
ncbi:hypothetical protein MKEN_01038000 [Mycena kentingensis (nom. inval.)]|nr:hypothetical protein MKEN_01038000 [Mycena kentingensis (nom. inval.)]